MIGAVPFPERLVVCGEVAALSDTDKIPLAAPVLLGSNTIPIVQEPEALNVKLVPTQVPPLRENCPPTTTFVTTRKPYRCW